MEKMPNEKLKLSKNQLSKYMDAFIENNLKVLENPHYTDTTKKYQELLNKTRENIILTSDNSKEEETLAKKCRKNNELNGSPSFNDAFINEINKKELEKRNKGSKVNASNSKICVNKDNIAIENIEIPKLNTPESQNEDTSEVLYYAEGEKAYLKNIKSSTHVPIILRKPIRKISKNELNPLERCIQLQSPIRVTSELIEVRKENLATKLTHQNVVLHIFNNGGPVTTPVNPFTMRTDKQIILLDTTGESVVLNRNQTCIDSTNCIDLNFNKQCMEYKKNRKKVSSNLKLEGKIHNLQNNSVSLVPLEDQLFNKKENSEEKQKWLNQSKSKQYFKKTLLHELLLVPDTFQITFITPEKFDFLHEKLINDDVNNKENIFLLNTNDIMTGMFLDQFPFFENAVLQKKVQIVDKTVAELFLKIRGVKPAFCTYQKPKLNTHKESYIKFDFLKKIDNFKKWKPFFYSKELDF